MTIAAEPPEDGRSDPYERTMAWLREHERIDPAAEIAGKRAASRSGEPLPLVLNRMGAVSDGDLQQAFSTVAQCPTSAQTPAPNTRDAVSRDFLRAHHAIVFDLTPDTAHVGLVDPFDEEAAAGVRFATGRDVELSVLRRDDQRRLFSELYETGDAHWSDDVTDRDARRVESAMEFDRDAPVARRVASWLAGAVEQRASDVHIEPRSQALVVRYRIDGALRTLVEEPLAAAAPVISRIKVLADLDLGERRKAQDGRTTIVVSGRPVDLRVSIIPSVHGESAVIRILDRSEVRLNWDRLGFAAREQSILRHMCGLPNGLFLVTGPTGSGKTTTLYSCLEAMRGDNRKVLAIEDPVEFHFDHVTQVQVAPKAGVTFPSAIRSFLRQDPDVILVGEIRDSETAQTAVQAALTGHLVLATVHAIDAARAPTRLLDMGVEPFQLDACLSGVLAQRLVRRLCPACQSRRLPTDGERRALGLWPSEQVPEAEGCPACGGTGYQGRLVVAEAHAATRGLLERLGAIGRDDAPDAAFSAGLLEDGLAKVRAGLTSPAELIRALSG